MDVTPDDPQYDIDGQLVLLAPHGPVDVHVQAPGVDVTVHAAPGAPATVRLPRDTVMVTDEDVPVDRAVHAATDGCTPFAALFRVPASGASVGDDVARLLPVGALGRRYQPVGYLGQAEVVVVGTEDDTLVTITDPHCPAPAPTLLARGQALLHRCVEPGNDGDITGTVIEASAPVAVMSGSAASRVIDHQLGPARFFMSWADILLESPWPVELLGRTHVHAPFRHESPGAWGDLLRIVSACAGATGRAEEADGTTWDIALAQEGDHRDLEVLDFAAMTGRLVQSGVVVDTDAPVLAAAFTVGGSGAGGAGIGDPSMSLLDATRHWERNAIAYCPEGYVHSLGIVVPAGTGGSVAVDGVVVTAAWEPVGDGARFEWTRLDDVPDGEHVVTGSDVLFVEVSGYLPENDAGAYSYPGVPFSDTGEPTLVVVGPAPCSPAGCPGECHVLSVPSLGGTQLWSTGEATREILACPDETSRYDVTVTDATGCALAGSTWVDVVVVPPLAITGPSDACEGDCVPLEASAGFDEYEWSTGDVGPVVVQCPTVPMEYTVTATHASGCRVEARHAVTPHPYPVPGTATVETLDPCSRGLLVTWTEATWEPGSPGGVYNVYRRDGACAPGDDPSWELVASGLTGLSHVDGTAETGRPYSYLVEAEDAPGPVACRPGPHAGGATARTCASPDAVADPGDPDAALLVNLSPHLRAVGYERAGPRGPVLSVTFAWTGAPPIDPSTHVEAFRSFRPIPLPVFDPMVTGTTWTDDRAGDRDLYFYRFFNATECGSHL